MPFCHEKIIAIAIAETSMERSNILFCCALAISLPYLNGSQNDLNLLQNKHFNIVHGQHRGSLLVKFIDQQNTSDAATGSTIAAWEQPNICHVFLALLPFSQMRSHRKKKEFFFLSCTLYILLVS